LVAADPSSTCVSPACLDPNGVRIHRVYSEFQSSETLIRVLLPDQICPGECLKTLYLLPVEAQLEQRFGDSLIEAKKLDLANKHRVICVAPTFSQLPWYADHPTDRTLRQESHFVKVVVPAIERLYPALPQRNARLLLGFSKSGNGAWTLLLRHPQMFARAAAWDAPLMKTAPDQFGMGPIYGSPENFENYRIDRLLRDRAVMLREDAGPRLIHLGYGNFREHHLQAESLLQELRIPHDYVDGPRLKHTWHSGWVGPAVERLLN
jgi:hypothetical protein